MDTHSTFTIPALPYLRGIMAAAKVDPTGEWWVNRFDPADPNVVRLLDRRAQREALHAIPGLVDHPELISGVVLWNGTSPRGALTTDGRFSANGLSLHLENCGPFLNGVGWALQQIA